MGIHRLLLLNIRKNGIFACHIIFPFNIIMIDFSKDPFDFAHISILSDQLLFFTKDTESYQPEIIEAARHTSSHCYDFVQHVLGKYKNKQATRVMFTPTMFSTIIRVCEADNDTEIRDFYIEMFKLITPSLETPLRFEYWSMRTVDNLLRIHMKAEDVDEISKLMLSLKRIPVAFIVDKYLKERPKELLNYAANHTHIYLGSKAPLNIGGPVPDPIMCDKVVRALYRVCNKLSYIVRRDLQRIYLDMDWEAVNAQEGTSFSQSFITWLKWACTHAVYIGTRVRNDGYPSWCFAPFSMDVCAEEEKTAQLGALYNYVCDILALDREKDVTVQLKPFYGEDVIPDKYAYAPIFTDDPRYDPKIDGIAASYTGNFVAETDFMHVCQRLFWDAGAGVYVSFKKECIIIPAGKGYEKYQLIREV